MSRASAVPLVESSRVATRRLTALLFVLGFALVIFGGKLGLIHFAGSDLPFWDQWDAESEDVVRPYVEGRLTLSDLTRPHNEHRIIPTKLLALGLLAANRQWDALLEMTANALIHVLCAVVCLLVGRRWLTGWRLTGYVGLLLLLFVLPFGWENTVRGFQGQFYFLLLFCLTHLWLSLRNDGFTWSWGLGQVAGAVAIVTMASGFLSSVALVAMLLFRLLQTRTWSAQNAVTFGIGIALTGAGWFLKTDHPGHEVLRASSLREFGASALRLFTWPANAFLPFGLVLVAPALVFIWRTNRFRNHPTDRVLLGLFTWSVLQVLALAYARGSTTDIASRYFDLLAIGGMLSWVLLAREFTGRTRTAVTLAWSVVFLAGLYDQTARAWRDNLVPLVPQLRQQETNVRSFLQTEDPLFILGKEGTEIPYPDPHVLLARLKNESIRQVLPASVRAPVRVQANVDPTLATVPDVLKAAPTPVAFSSWNVGGENTSVDWESTTHPLKTLPVLRFRVAGEWSRSDPAMMLNLTNENQNTPVQLESRGGLRWKTVNVVRPKGAWRIEARDQDPTSWFAFTEPVEVGYGSWLNGKLIKSHDLVLIAGFAAMAAACLIHWKRSRRHLLEKPSHPAA
jgi:hypothetical protein